MTETLITQNDEQRTIVLEEPLARGSSNITEVVVRKPNSGALRGARLQALLEMDVDSMILVLPRVTIPALTKSDLLSMTPGDLINLSVEVVNFLLPKSAKSGFQTD
ncbi:phage tail assembly protein [Photorhabdus luminescens]|uniref:Phage tail assembly protein n=3 Tax=Photorhabdus TaxID=29487 RepID=A0A2S8PWA1_9GAMM|nr:MULTISPECIES: phage tail assembly protein [Photorhabdus]PQQ32276.1 phage tail assembly protein [Photorhabdus luminescens]EYU13571.1 Mu-like prophage FluMu protein gp41 [Photorhabdus aegyptia]MBS9428442.1 phage tail assembly protein [Photorhabdus akhurstii]MBS9436784.1 phage tail assembly protein [Photorhabdus noenieputensis]MCC8456693.1 phage tail assembly protein [Photorhabdus aegyptia]